MIDALNLIQDSDNTRIAEILISESSGVDHIAYATPNTTETLALLESLGYRTVIHKKHIERFNIFVSKLINSKNDVAEVVEIYDKSKRSPIDNYVKDNQCTVYHICYKVDDFNATYKALRDMGSLVVTKPFESYLFDGYMVSHMFNQSLGLFEIFGRKKDERD
jgi:4-hydroxyphenylpyruvate dioxygenase-like putative hemolysin